MLFHASPHSHMSFPTTSSKYSHVPPPQLLRPTARRNVLPLLQLLTLTLRSSPLRPVFAQGSELVAERETIPSVPHIRLWLRRMSDPQLPLEKAQIDAFEQHIEALRISALVSEEEIPLAG